MNTLRKFFFLGNTNVYLYQLLRFFNLRKSNNSFLNFISKCEILFRSNQLGRRPGQILMIQKC